MNTDIRSDIVKAADCAYEDVRSINHATLAGRAIPAPEMYDILGNLKTALGAGADQALRQLADRLKDSMQVYALYEDDQARKPATSIMQATERMRIAANLADQIYDHLAAAQNAIAGQSYHNPDRTDR